MPAIVTTWSTPGVLRAISPTWSIAFCVRSSDAPSGKLHGDQQVALVLDRNEAGGHARQPPAGKRDDGERRR